MSYTNFYNCPHCWSFHDDEHGGFEDSLGCEKCNNTGKRILDEETVECFESMRDFFDNQVEAAFENWQRIVLNRNDIYDVASYSINGSMIDIDGKRYIGCREYDRENFRMPTKFIIGGEMKEKLEEEAKLRKIKEEEERKKKIEADRIRQIAENERKAKEKEAHDQAEYKRLKEKYEK